MHSFGRIYTTSPSSSLFLLILLSTLLLCLESGPVSAFATVATRPKQIPVNMTKHNLLNLVSANLGLRVDDNKHGNHPNYNQADGPPNGAPQPPQFHIASKEHFVHPLPGTYPRLAVLPDSSILFGFTSFSDPSPTPGQPPSQSPQQQRILSIARSIDNGRTFTPHGEVTRSPGDADNLYLLPLPAPENNNNNRILAAFRNHDYDQPNSTNTYAHFRITVCESLDNGRTWHFLSQAYEKPAPFGLWEPFMRVSRQRPGEVQLFFSGELSADDQDTFLCVSRDGGRTWRAPMTITGMEHGPATRLRDGMVGIAETRDTQGREVLVMVLETTRGEGGRKYAVECLLSYDDGLSWGWRQVVYMPMGGRRNAGAPQVASFSDGEVAVVFMTDEDIGLGGSNEWPGGAKIKVLFGGRPDNGRIFWRESGEPRVLSSAGAAGEGRDGVELGGGGNAFWPGVVRLADDKVLAVYENGGIIRGRMITKN